MKRVFATVAWTALAAVLAATSCTRKPKVTAEEARAIAKEAYIYALPMVEAYKVLYIYSIYRDNPEYKAPLNTIAHAARVFTPADSTIQTPNSDTPYSMAWLDLRTEPVVITVPPIEEGRYYSVQLIDLYTFNFDYIGTRATGNGGGSYLVAPPGWSGQAPAGIAKVIPCETQFALAAFRTQLFSPDDIENVKKVQAGYDVKPLSAFTGTAAPKPPREMIFPPYSPSTAKSIAFFQYLNFMLQFCPTHPSEAELRTRFARIGIEPGESFNVATLPTEMSEALRAGIDDAVAAIDGEAAKAMLSKDAFGTRDVLQNNYLTRAAAAKVGLFGNSKEEALYSGYRTDAEGQPLDGAHAYTLRFEDGTLPPANAFWSVTMYDGVKQTLVPNPINRYVINSPMLSTLARDKDGGITLYLQHESPGKAKESNWLPSPAREFYVVLRLYLPKTEALDGTWTAPPVVKVK